MSVLIVGGSRGIGAALVRVLDSLGVGGVFTYCAGEVRARRIEVACARWRAVKLDLACMPSASIQDFLDEVGHDVTTVVLCAAVGMQAGRTRGHAENVNALAPLRLISRLDVLNKEHFGLMYVTSTAAHEFDDSVAAESLGVYDLVARSKRLGETLLQRLAPQWTQCRSYTTVVSDLVVPSTAYWILRRREPETVRRLDDSGRTVPFDPFVAWLAESVQALESGRSLPKVMEYENHG